MAGQRALGHCVTDEISAETLPCHRLNPAGMRSVLFHFCVSSKCSYFSHFVIFCQHNIIPLKRELLMLNCIIWKYNVVVFTEKRYNLYEIISGELFK